MQKNTYQACQDLRKTDAGRHVSTRRLSVLRSAVHFVSKILGQPSGFKTLLLLLFVTSNSLVWAQGNGSRLANAMHSKMANPQKVIEQLSQQARDWDKAIINKDRQAIAANMAQDFRQIGPTGELEDKASFIQGLLDPNLSIQPYTVEDFEVRLYGKVALLSGRTRMQGEYQGKPFTTHYRYIDVYVLRGKKWQIVSVQITRLAS